MNKKLYAVKNDEGKIVLTKKQAEIVENARIIDIPATYISESANLAVSGEEDLLMKAYVNGYIVEKDKKFKYECQDMSSHEAIATFNTYDEAYNFLDVVYSKPGWWTIPVMEIMEVTDDD